MGQIKTIRPSDRSQQRFELVQAADELMRPDVRVLDLGDALHEI